MGTLGITNIYDNLNNIHDEIMKGLGFIKLEEVNKSVQLGV